MTSSTVTVFRGVRPFGAGAPVELIAVDGLLADRVPADVPVEVVDGGGRIALPTLVDAHIHPDKTAWGEPWYSHRPTDALPEYVRGDVDLYEHQRTPLAERAHRLLASQVVAFPQHGVRRTPGAGALLAEAAASGLIDAVGGIDPAGFDGVGADAEGPAQLDQVFGLAEQHGLHLDIHLHDTGDRGLGPLRDIAARTRAAGLQGRVVVSHTFCVPELAGAAELATRNATPAELRGLEQVLARTRKAAEAGRLRETVGLDADFHRAIVELSGNPLLQDMMAPLDGRLRRLFRLTSGPESTSPMCTEHGQLLAAIRSGDPAAAADLARRYVAGTRAFALEVLGRGDA